MVEAALLSQARRRISWFLGPMEHGSDHDSTREEGSDSLAATTRCNITIALLRLVRRRYRPGEDGFMCDIC
jgi:hypothetical protein